MSEWLSGAQEKFQFCPLSLSGLAGYSELAHRPELFYSLSSH